jgi:multimeric flavodoxin WrbA
MKMKVLGLSCSPRKDGNTAALVNLALSGAKREGAEVEYFSVAGKQMAPCDGCRSCATTGVCHIKDDMQEVYKLFIESDAIIFGTPTYCYSIAAQAKIIMDRSRALHDLPEDNKVNKLANKPCGVIAVGASLGLVEVVKDLYFWMVTRYMLPGDYVALYAQSKGDVEKRPEGKKATINLGRQMVRLAAMKFAYPADLMKPAYAYGTWRQ